MPTSFSFEDAMGPSKGLPTEFADRSGQVSDPVDFGDMPTTSVVGELPKDRALLDTIRNTAKEYGVPEEYGLALAQQESGYNPKAFNSEFGATGLLQFTPENFKKRGFDPYDPQASIREAMIDFKREMDEGGPDWAIKHHFAGPNVKGHGPKTRQYLADVSKRAKDIRALLDSQTSGTVVAGDSDAGPKQPVGSFSFEDGLGPSPGKVSSPKPAEDGGGVIEALKNTGNAVAKAATRSFAHVQNRFLTDLGQISPDDPRYTPRRGVDDPFAENRDIIRRTSERADAAARPNVPGFWANVKNPVALMTEDSLPANFIESLNNAPERERQKFWDARKVLMQQNIVDNPEKFPAVSVEAAQAEIDKRTAKQDPGVREMWSQLVKAAKEDPKRFGAELTNALIADPYMVLVPEGVGLNIIEKTRKARGVAEAASKITKLADRVIDAGSTGAALNIGMEAAKAESEGRDITGSDIAFAGGTGATLGGLSALLTRGNIARQKIAGREVNADTLEGIMRDVAKEDMAVEGVVNEDANIPVDVRKRIEETLGIQNMSKTEKKRWHAQRKKELEKTFADQSLEADYLEFKAEERVLRAEQLRQDARAGAAEKAAEAERVAAFEASRQQTLGERSVRFQEEYDAALKQRDEAVQGEVSNAWAQEDNLRKITKELDEAEILDAAFEDAPAVRRAMNSSVRRDGNLARPKWQRGEVDPQLVARLGVGGLFAGTAFALAPEDQKLKAAGAALLAGLVVPGGGRVLDRMRQSGVATVDGDLVGLLTKQGKLRPDRLEFEAKQAETIELAKKGDQRAYKELYEEYFPQVQRYVKQFVREAGPRLGIDAEDVAQEAFISAFRNIENFRGDAKFSTWLHGIAKNEGLMAIREAKSQRGGGEYDIVSAEKPALVNDYGETRVQDEFTEGAGANLEDTPEAQARRQEVEDQLIRAIEKLPKDAQEIFLLNRVEQYTAQEIADMKGMNLAAVLQRLKRSQDFVAEQLAKDMGAVKKAEPETQALASAAEEPVKRGRGRPPGKYGSYNKQKGEVDPRLLRVGAVAGLGAVAGFYLNDQNRLLGAGIGALAGAVALSKGRRGETVMKQVMDKADYTLGITSTRLMNKSKEIWRRAIEHERVVLRDTHKHLAAVDPFLERLNKLPKETRDILSRAVLTGRAEVTNRLLSAIGDGELSKAWKATRSTLDSLGDQLVAAKRFTKGNLDYFPRIVKDVDGLLKALGKERGSFLEEAIKKADTEAIQKRGTGLTDLEKSLVINKVLASEQKAGNQPGFAKNRGVEEITPELQQFYASPAESLHSYIRAAVEDIERAKFFGKDLEVIKSGDKEYTNVDKSIGSVVQRMINEGKLSGKDAEEVHSMLKSRFINGERAPWEIIQAGKNLTYAGLLGNPFSAVTQLGDAIIQSYTQDVRSTLDAIVRNVTGRKIVNMKDFGLSDHIAEEFVSTSKTAKALNKIFKYTLFKGIDEFGKDTALNASVIKNSRLARSEGGIQQLVSKYGEYLQPGEMEQLIKDLQKGEPTDLVRSIAFAELSRTQPITRLELPQAYLDHPNGRLLYQFKTFMLKQIDVARRDGFNEIKKGNVATGLKNLTQLGLALGVAGMTTDKIKDFLLGKEVDLSASDVPMNMLKSFGLTEYYIDNFFGVSKEEASERRKAGDTNARTTPAKPLESTINTFAPPAQMFDQVVTGDKKALRYIPFVGPLLYEQAKSEAQQ